MSAIYPLSNLQDPSAFLAGALLPITDIEPEHPDDRWFWLRDHLIRINGEDPLPVILERVQQIPLEGGEGLALDLAEENTARWVDRKIAEAIVARILNRSYGQIVSAVLGISRKAWVVTALHEDGRVYPWGFHREEAQALLSVPVAPANMLTVRSALLSALFGRAKS